MYIVGRKELEELLENTDSSSTIKCNAGEKVLETAQEQNFYTLTVETDPQIQRAFEVAQNLVANQ